MLEVYLKYGSSILEVYSKYTLEVYFQYIWSIFKVYILHFSKEVNVLWNNSKSVKIS